MDSSSDTRPVYFGSEVIEMCEALLTHFNIDFSEETIVLDSSANSIICNPNTQFPFFLGHSIREVAEIVAEYHNKKITWVYERGN